MIMILNSGASVNTSIISSVIDGPLTNSYNGWSWVRKSGNGIFWSKAVGGFGQYWSKTVMTVKDKERIFWSKTVQLQDWSKTVMTVKDKEGEWLRCWKAFEPTDQLQ